MQFLKSIGTACSSFAITNIDDMFVLATFFAEASTSKTITPLKITLGQYVGFTVIIIISMIGFGVSLVLPSEPIGFLGLLPLLLGIWQVLNLVFSSEEEEEEIEHDQFAGAKSIFKVALITVMNGGDNIGTYIPLFSQAKGAEIAVYVVTYYILLGIWCLVAYLVMKQRHMLFLAQKYADIVVPFLYMGLGVYVVVKSSCYPWTVEKIDESGSALPGRTILVLVTAVSFLVCIAGMLWLQLRQRAVSPESTLDDESAEPMLRDTELSSSDSESPKQTSGGFHSEID